MVTATDDHRLEVKKMLVSQLRRRMEPAEIGDDTPLFGEGLALDSVDAIELVSALEQKWNVVVTSEAEAKEILVSVNVLTEYVVAQGGLS